MFEYLNTFSFCSKTLWHLKSNSINSKSPSFGWLGESLVRVSLSSASDSRPTSCHITSSSTHGPSLFALTLPCISRRFHSKYTYIHIYMQTGFTLLVYFETKLLLAAAQDLASLQVLPSESIDTMTHISSLSNWHNEKIKV